MNNVFQFPSADVRNWIEIERVLRAELPKLGATPDLVTHVCAKIRVVQERYCTGLSMTIPADAAPAVLACAEHFRMIVGCLIGEIVIREVHLYLSEKR